MNLPCNLDAERAVLGATLASPAAMTEVAPLLEPADFYQVAHETIWATMTGLHAAGDPVDPITVAAALGRAGELARVGGPVYLADLLASVTATSNAAWHAGIVREQATRRTVLRSATQIAQVAASTEGTAADLLAIAQAELAAAHRPDPTATRTLIGDLIDDAIDSIEAHTAPGISWPWLDLNRTLNPAAAGQLILFAARPAVGKSVACVEVARHAALHRGIATVLHSLEMSTQEVVLRILAAEAAVPLTHLQRGEVTEYEWAKIAKARAVFNAAPLHIVDTPAVSVADLRASIQKHNPGLLVVDYIQLARTNPKMDRRQGLEELSRDVKILAKSAGIPIVAAAQLNRGPEQRVDRRPQMSDLRETGSLENDADVIVLLHRPDQAEPECERAGEIDLIVAKQRGGPTGTTTLVHQLHYSRFMDFADSA